MPIVSGYAKYYPLYLLSKNLEQINTDDLLSMSSEVQYKSQTVENYISNGSTKTDLDGDSKPTLKQIEFKWNKDNESVEFYSIILSKVDYQEVDLLFQYDTLHSILINNYTGADIVTINAENYWHIKINGDLLHDQLTRINQKSLELVYSFAENIDNECDAGDYQDLEIDYVKQSDEVIGDLEFYIDAKSGKLFQIVVPNLVYTQEGIAAKTCDSEPQPVVLNYKTQYDSATRIDIKNISYRKKFSPENIGYISVYKFVFDNNLLF